MSVQNKRLYFCDFCGREQSHDRAFDTVTAERYTVERPVGYGNMTSKLDICGECQRALVVFIASLKAGGTAHG